jgi:anti-anti-sigma factor
LIYLEWRKHIVTKGSKPFEITVTACEQAPGVALIELSGYLDTHTVSEFDEEMFVRRGPDFRFFVTDMADLSYISSAGIASLMKLVQQTRKRGGEVILLRPGEQVYSILELLGFTDIFRFTATLEEALALLTDDE